jgi:hypothetical protein
MVDVSVRETAEHESFVFENRDIQALANSDGHHTADRRDPVEPL